MANFAKGLDSMGDLFPDPPSPQALHRGKGSAWAGVAGSFRAAGGSIRKALADAEKARRENGPTQAGEGRG